MISDAREEILEQGDEGDDERRDADAYHLRQNDQGETLIGREADGERGFALAGRNGHQPGAEQFSHLRAEGERQPEDGGSEGIECDADARQPEIEQEQDGQKWYAADGRDIERHAPFQRPPSRVAAEREQKAEHQRQGEGRDGQHRRLAHGFQKQRQPLPGIVRVRLEELAHVFSLP